MFACLNGGQVGLWDTDRYDRLLPYVSVEKNNGDVYLFKEVLARDGNLAADADVARMREPRPMRARWVAPEGPWPTPTSPPQR